MNLDDLRLTPEDYRPQPPSGRHYRIGLIGCGGIANGAHLPAYRDFGYEVVACSDIDPGAVEATQARWGIEAAGTDPRVVLDNPQVEVIDLAVHPHARLKLWPALLEAGKPILSQKPFAMTWEDAVSMATSAQASGVTLMINQQARWAPAHAAIKLLIDTGICGPLFSVAHVRRGYQDQPDKWWRDVVNFNIVDHGVHFLDLIRHFSGRTPDAVSATTAMMQGQNAVSPLSHTLALHFDSGDLTAIDHFNNIIQSRAAHSEFWHIDGAEGSISWDSTVGGRDAARRTRAAGAIPDRGVVVPGGVRRQHGRADGRAERRPRAIDLEPRQPELNPHRGGGGAQQRRAADGKAGRVLGLAAFHRDPCGRRDC